jgi:hypothetical protein
MSTALFYNSDVGRWHINQCQIVGDQFDNIGDFIDSHHDHKFAVMHTPSFEDTTEFEQSLQSLIDHCDLIILLTSEVHNDSVKLIQRNQHKKIISFVCGALNFDYPHKHWLDWFVTSSHFYKTNNVLEKLTPYSVKSKTFDILLGQPKPHRTLIYNFAKDYDDHVIMTYFKDHTTPLNQYSEKNWIWESEGLEIPTHDFNFTVTPVYYYGHHMSLSQIVPISIYNQTAYSVVAETNFDNHYTFYTEKIVKPILARRLFLVFSGQYYLRNLRNLGFRTFDGIIDESYDDVADLNQRGQMITEQMKYLLEQDQKIIFDQIKPIVEHNYRLMIETDWYQEFAKEFQAVVLGQP